MRFLLVTIMMILGSGCVVAPDPVPLTQEFWDDKDKSVAIVVGKLPKGDFLTTGQQGLLDLAINEGANSALNDHLATLDFSEFVAIADDFKTLIEEGGVAVASVDIDFALPELKRFSGKSGEGLVYAQLDYRPLKKTLNTDRLLLITVPWAGIERPYYGFIPTGEPLANLVAEGRLVDLESNRVLWRARLEGKMSIAEPWDEPPAFPNATTAFFKSVEQTRNLLKNDFRVMPVVDEAAGDVGTAPADAK